MSLSSAHWTQFLRRTTMLLLAATAFTRPLIAEEVSPQRLADAKKALQIIGADVEGSSKRCAGCHNLNLETLRRWKDATSQANYGCSLGVTSMDVSTEPWSPPGPLKRIQCLEDIASKQHLPLGAQHLGFYAAGLHLPHFDKLFAAAYPEDKEKAKLTALRNRAQMPHGGANLMTQEEFDTAFNWLSGMDQAERLLARTLGLDKPCKQELKPELTDHVRKMMEQGWATRNRDNGMQMFACPRGSNTSSPLACFKQKKADGSDFFPEVTTLGAPSAQVPAGGHFRFLTAMAEKTVYWTRSSPDGRFLATGIDAAAPSDSENTLRYGQVTDLLPLLTPAGKPHDYKMSAARYDPAFFPDGSQFMFQARGMRGYQIICPMSLLTAPSGDELDIAKCFQQQGIGLYQSTAASLNGGDLVAISGDYVENDGQGTKDVEPAPAIALYARLDLAVLVNDGTALRSGRIGQIATPFFSDSVVAPSGSLLSGRIAGVDAHGDPRQNGYSLKLISTKPTDGPAGANVYDITLTDVATICTKGHKATFSFDERFVTYSHKVMAEDWQELGFTSADADEFKKLLAKNTTNIYVTDLLNGSTVRLTHMAAGQLAQFPHFRSDGWLYFQVYDEATKARSMVATDMAILLGNASN